ncbi:MAG TPA: HAD-IB family phosphatase [Thermoleophilia bacterium]|nr:HAD-IB family phosphatase [Thermoleophilia bacterium]
MTDSSPPVPDLSRLLVLLDYDGTVTDHEYNERALQLLTGDAWRPFEEASSRGEIGHAECLERQVGLVTADKEELIAANADPAQLTPGFDRFLGWLLAGGARVNVVSAGFREGIERFWRRYDLPPVPIYASEIVSRDGGGGPPWGVEFNPLLSDCERCGPASCKAGILRTLKRDGDLVAVFGDGVSDLCLARLADIVFARPRLADFCAREGIACELLGDYDEARARLAAWLGIERRS